MEISIFIEGNPDKKTHDIQARDIRQSLLFCPDDDPARPDSFLLKTSLQVISAAMQINLDDLTERVKDRTPPNPSFWPGEHYRLLSAFVKVLRPRLVIEIGTATGLSALSMKKSLLPESRLATFDVVPWQQYPGQALVESDFDDQFVQVISDLTQMENFENYRKLFQCADIIFIDAAKDGFMEQTFLNHLETVRFEKPPVVIFDDIRLWNMLSIWRKIRRPKMDLTSFGNWSGTGVIHWV